MSDMPDALIRHHRNRYGIYSWEGQALQYDQLGPVNEIVYRRYDDDVGRLLEGGIVDTLLYYDVAGKLAGVLNYYPEGALERDGTRLEHRGNVNFFARPGTDENSVTAVLKADAQRRWHLPDEAFWEVDRAEVFRLRPTDAQHRLRSAPNR